MFLLFFNLWFGSSLALEQKSSTTGQLCADNVHIRDNISARAYTIKLYFKIIGLIHPDAIFHGIVLVQHYTATHMAYVVYECSRKTNKIEWKKILIVSTQISYYTVHTQTHTWLI